MKRERQREEVNIMQGKKWKEKVEMKKYSKLWDGIIFHL